MSRFKSPSHEKSILLKIRSLFSFKFFQGHNWLTNYPDSEFHGRWKTVTLSSISSNLSKHWRFLAFWLSLCFGSFLLFLVCHDTAFLFSKREMTALGWLPNAHRDMIFGTVRQTIPWYIQVWLMIFNQFSSIFFLEFLILSMMNTQLARDVTWRESLLFYRLPKLSYLGNKPDFWIIFSFSWTARTKYENLLKADVAHAKKFRWLCILVSRARCFLVTWSGNEGLSHWSVTNLAESL